MLYAALSSYDYDYRYCKLSMNSARWTLLFLEQSHETVRQYARADYSAANSSTPSCIITKIVHRYYLPVCSSKVK